MYIGICGTLIYKNIFVYIYKWCMRYRVHRHNTHGHLWNIYIQPVLAQYNVRMTCAQSAIYKLFTSESGGSCAIHRKGWVYEQILYMRICGGFTFIITINLREMLYNGFICYVPEHGSYICNYKHFTLKKHLSKRDIYIHHICGSQTIQALYANVMCYVAMTSSRTFPP